MSVVYHRHISEYLLNDKPLGLIFSLVAILLIAVLTGLALLNEFEVIIWGIFLSLPLLYYFAHNPKLWIFTATLATAYFFRDSTEGLSLLDVVSGLFYLGGLLIWFYDKIFIKRAKVVESIADIIIISFFFLLAFNIVIAYFNNADLLEWLREYSLFVLILFYFPIKEHITSKKDMITLLLILCFVTFILNLVQFYQYYALVSRELVYAFHFSASIRANQSLYAAAPIFGLIFASFQKKRIYKYLLLIFSTLSVMALLATFSRAYWIVLIVNLLLIVILSPQKTRKFMVIYSLIGGVLFFLISFIIFRDKIEFVLYVIENRFVSTAAGTKDISVQMRLNEFNAAISEIEKYPLGGSGMSKKFKFYDPIGITTQHSNFIHNGYLYYTYRIGIPLAALLFIFILIMMVKGFYYSIYTPDPFYRAIAIGAATTVFMMVITNFITTTISARDGSLILAYVFAFISIVEKNNRKLNKEQKK